jgi:peptide/nickel transport system permease protein
MKSFYGLDLPIYQQYFNWLSNLFQGDLGSSFRNGVPVTELIAERIPRTLILCFGAVIFGVLISFPAGIYSAWRQGGWGDFAVTSYSLLLLSVPQFWLGLFLMLIFSFQLGWLPSSGWVYPGRDFIGFLKILIMPTVTTGFLMAAVVTRMLRSSMIDVLSKDYINLARSKGNPEKRVLLIHSVRNSLIPVVTVIGFQIGYLLGGEIVVEKVFNYPGMGFLIVFSASYRDYPVIQVSILFYAILFMVTNLIIDIIYALIDPTIRY